MGATSSNAKYGGKRNSKRGSTNNANRLAAFASGSAAGGADWGSASPERIQGVVVEITALGGAVTFGLSRDKGAHSMTLMLDGHRETMWYNGDAVLDDELDAARTTIASIE